MYCDFNFRPVGQGAFFTGVFKKNGETRFNFAYDCGTLTAGKYLTNQIEDAKIQLPVIDGKRTIDMLIISHFDEDHINGVVEFLEDIRCCLLIIPFLSIYERLTVFAKGSAKAEWHRQFLENPQVFLTNREYDIDLIVMIDGNGDTLTENVDVPNIPLEPDAINGYSERYKTPDEDGFSFNNKVKYLRVPFALHQSQTDFIFKFYTKKFPQTLIGEFEAAVTEELPSLRITDLFQDKYRLIIKGIYKRIFKNMNKTSLCVSIQRTKRFRVWYDDDPNSLFDYDSRKVALILTGDSFLKDEEDRDEFVKYYSDEIADALLFQIPHHGSKNNSFLDIANQLWSFIVFVMQHGSKRKKHPSKELNDFVLSNHFHVRRITELQGFSLKYTIT